MASSTPGSNNKRRRTASPKDDGGALSIYHLLPDHLIAIADYLPQTSRAIFAVALASTLEAFVTKDGQQPNEASKAVILLSANEGWETLDFADVGHLAARLNDYRSAVLMLIILYTSLLL